MEKTEMSSNVCMNVTCGSTLATEWKKGWALPSGQYAHLCDNCGIAFDELNFCEKFHSKESGWRECTTCKKALHCGCVASLSLLQPLDDGGGVTCILCSISSLTSPKQEVCNQTTGDKMAVGFGSESPLEGHNDDTNTNSSDEIKPTTTFQTHAGPEIMCSNLNETSLCFPNISTVLSVALGNPEHPSNLKTSSGSYEPVSKLQCIPSKPSKSAVFVGVESNMSTVSQIGSLRPPIEVVRSRSHLLPRYWPRITDLELQQISGDSKSTIVPLFEKVLSASDAGRIGRLVLPKACAEAYFPPISLPEGLPLRIQDVRGKDWTFQFRFWPNNNSRMYVLEGVTPCIHSMQLRAGDTVTFSRMEPEGKLIMGFRKAPHPTNSQDAQVRATPTTLTRSTDTLLSDAVRGIPMAGESYLSLLRSFKGCTDGHFEMHSKHSGGQTGTGRWVKMEGRGDGMRENQMPSSAAALLDQTGQKQQQQQRYVGAKNKMPAIDNECTLEIRVTWEELQGLFRPPPCSNPTVITVEEYEVEEYEKPPVFGKWGIFTTRTTGGVEQWGQCDKCFKWRRVPVDYLLPPTWTCSDNTWDSKRSWCSAAEELSQGELENLLRLHSEFKRLRGEASPGVGMALFGGDMVKPVAESAATTTKHPRHRPGCSCIVCIQPPSGKGKHKPSCVCNVCMTVKRRFKTLMMRKKKRQSECEAEIALRSRQQPATVKDETEAESTMRLISYTTEPSSEGAAVVSSNSPGIDKMMGVGMEERSEEVDLNSEPMGELKGMSMMSLVEVATLPLESYLRQQGIQSLFPFTDTSSEPEQEKN